MNASAGHSPPNSGTVHAGLAFSESVSAQSRATAFLAHKRLKLGLRRSERYMYTEIERGGRKSVDKNHVEESRTLEAVIHASILY